MIQFGHMGNLMDLGISSVNTFKYDDLSIRSALWISIAVLVIALGNLHQFCWF